MKALLVFCFLCVCPAIYAQAPLTITTEPKAIVWIDDIRRGTTDESGKLVVTKVSAGRHSIRIRAAGFKEATMPLAAGRRALNVKLVPTTDQAELLFQQAESAREKARDESAQKKAVELYREAIKLRPAFPAAHVGLARVLLDLNEFKEAHAAIDAARRARPSYAEASAVEGRIYREEAFDDDALRSFRRAIREAGGVQPEAYVGMAKVYEDKGQFALAVNEYRRALAQLSDSEPVIYQMIGAAYERIEKPKEAVAAYEKYLQLAPNGSYAAAIRSILEQLKREAAGDTQIIP
ncbi:MAG TPA: tetratricopeptide repeat protein [Pyrinomonadaceae bacterium]|nr:tetratricopeptide repeat protein [Pyrinomonadaceae bacterium]